jgi:hypothetical protein
MPSWKDGIENKPLIEEIFARLIANSSVANEPPPQMDSGFGRAAAALVMTAEAEAQKGNVPIRDAVERMYRDYKAGLVYVGFNSEGFKVSRDEEEVKRWADNSKDSIVAWIAPDGTTKLRVAWQD